MTPHTTFVIKPKNYFFENPSSFLLINCPAAVTRTIQHRHTTDPTRRNVSFFGRRKLGKPSWGSTKLCQDCQVTEQTNRYLNCLYHLCFFVKQGKSDKCGVMTSLPPFLHFMRLSGDGLVAIANLQLSVPTCLRALPTYQCSSPHGIRYLSQRVGI